MIDLSNPHGIHDLRSLYIHQFVSNKLMENPSLIKKARDNLNKSKKVSDLLVFLEWEIILSAPVDKVCDFITRDSQAAIRLRQSSPFHGFITKEERRHIDEQIKLRTLNKVCVTNNR